MTTPSTPKKRRNRKKVISSRWAVPPDQSDGMVEGASPKKTVRPCRCQPASPNSSVPNSCQCMQRKEQLGTMAKTTRPQGPPQMAEGAVFATRPVPLDISATSSEATTNSWSRTEPIESKRPYKLDASEDEEKETETEPTMESLPTRKSPVQTVSRPSPPKGNGLGNKPSNQVEPVAHNWKTSLIMAQRRKKTKRTKPKTIEDEEVMKTIDLDDEDLTEEEKEMIRLRGKATLMKLCMESCTEPIYRKKGETYKGKYHNTDDIIDEWKSNPETIAMGEQESDDSELDDEISHSADNEPVLERPAKRGAARSEHDEGYEGIKYSEKGACRTCKARISKKQQMGTDSGQPLQAMPGGPRLERGTRNLPERSTMRAENRKKTNARKLETGRIYSQTPTSGSPAFRNSKIIQEEDYSKARWQYRRHNKEEKEIDVDKEERWCEMKCKQIAWGTEENEIGENGVQNMAMGEYDLPESFEQSLDDTEQQEMMFQEPEMTSAQRPENRRAERNEVQEEDIDEEEDDHEKEEYSLWCDKTCETIARLPEMWDAPEPTGIIVRVIERGKKYDQPQDESEPQLGSAPGRTQNLAKNLASWRKSQLAKENPNFYMTDEEKENKIQKMIQICRKICLEQQQNTVEVKKPESQQNSDKTKLGGKEGTGKLKGSLPKVRAKRKQELDSEELERRENEMGKMKLRQNIVELCMEKCNKIMAEGKGGQGGTGQSYDSGSANRPNPQLATEPTMSSEPQKRHLPQDYNTTEPVAEGSQFQSVEFCEEMRSACEKLADELVEQHYKYGSVRPGYGFHLDETPGPSDAQESKFESGNRMPRKLLSRNGPKMELKEDSEPKYTTMKQNLNVLRNKISRNNTEEAADLLTQEDTLRESSPSSRRTVARTPRPNREPQMADVGAGNRAEYESGATNPVQAVQDTREEFYQALEEFEGRYKPCNEFGVRKRFSPPKKSAGYHCSYCDYCPESFPPFVVPLKYNVDSGIEKLAANYTRNLAIVRQPDKSSRATDPLRGDPRATINEEALLHQTPSPQVISLLQKQACKLHSNQQRTFTQKPQPDQEASPQKRSPGPQQEPSPVRQPAEQLEQTTHPVHHPEASYNPQPGCRERTSPFEQKPEDYEQTPTNNPEPDHEQTSTHRQPDYREETTTHGRFSYHTHQTLPPSCRDSSAQTVTGPQQGPKAGGNERKENLRAVSESISLSVTSTSSRVMFADQPITSPPNRQFQYLSTSTTSLTTKCGSNESFNACLHAKSRSKRGCLKCPVSSERRNFSKTMYLRGEQLSKPRDSVSRSRSPSPSRRQDPRTGNDSTSLRGPQQDEGYSFVHEISDISIERSQHSLTVCAQAEARRRLINRNMIKTLGLEGIAPVVVEKTIGGCTWGVKAYRV